MKATISMILIAVLLFAGCTSHHSVQAEKADDYTSLNKRAKGNKAKVTFLDGQWVLAKNLQFAPDSTSWIDPGTGETQKVSSTEIADIRFLRHGKGAVAGLGVGLAVGALTGVLIGAVAGGDDPDQFLAFSAGEKAAMGGVLLGGLGGLLGIPIGAAKGSEEIYHIEPENSTDVTQKLNDSAQIIK